MWGFDVNTVVAFVNESDLLCGRDCALGAEERTALRIISGLVSLEALFPLYYEDETEGWRGFQKTGLTWVCLIGYRIKHKLFVRICLDWPSKKKCYL